jgi:hypothetical protein
MDKHLTCVATYPRPLRGTFNGQDVTILATGDIEGESPVFQVVEANGRTTWQSLDKVTISETSSLSGERGERLASSRS